VRGLDGHHPVRPARRADIGLLARAVDLTDLGAPLRATEDVVPWIPAGLVWTPRWVLLHLIEETPRHAGHADIIRESLDGAPCWMLMAAAEGWPERSWT
jgi:Protein of unknown function (DUF664)